ncbi:MAG TPA: hypothetical protein VFR32_05670 [Gaiellaceae bacterium]|nr:hypothetical protein [Gaiellaceae bacterium]
MRRGLFLAAALVAALPMAACGGNGGTPDEGSSAAAAVGSARAILERPGPDIALVPGTSDYARGPVRVVFLVIDSRGRSIERARARVWVARSFEHRPFLRTTARLEGVGVPGVSEAAAGDVTKVYVARFRMPRAGKYVLIAEPAGGRPIQGALDLEVKEEPVAPAVGAKAFPSRTPTITSTGGDLDVLTTRNPPDVALLRHSVADSLADRAPFVLAFATPKFCTSRACGPVVDVVDHVRKRLGDSPVRFIHVEIFEDNQPPELNRWVKEWKLPTEPWVFLVGGDGLIKERFEGSVSAAELEAAVRAKLLR